ncbi:MAG: alanine/ornithine racemase family PLP-dependent enzyme, partial [Lutibacter sp.]|nr:alanine/ornithine racemase family PLP-dependent enzyme [Lutibacter sp.]
GVNHFRIGESLFFGVDLFTNKTIPKMKNDVFMLYAEIIEITEKPIVPYGYMEENPSGETLEIDPEDYGKNHSRGILDIGLLDISKTEFIMPVDENISFIGASSDMLVVDLSQTAKKYKVGDLVRFKMKYMGALRIMNSEYIEKKLV